MTAITAKTKIKTAPFGITPDGEPVELYTLTNKSGMQLSLSSYGATITRLLAPDRDGKLADVALGFDSLTPYLTSKIYLGCTVGRFANRIAQAARAAVIRYIDPASFIVLAFNAVLFGEYFRFSVS